MSKLLFWIVIILVALVVARIAARNAANRGARPPAAPPPRQKPRTPAQAAQVMVRCAHCGTHLPTSEAVRRGGWNYCGLAHSLKGPKP